MNNKGVGVVFCLIAAILAAARYVAAAVFMSNVSSWSEELFQCGLEYVGSPLKIMAVVALIVGIVFLVLGVCQDLRKSKKD
ncbi:MAG: hypothetical protein J5633_01630 [Oscillospiraceae bacterium]|nr:hypothetical protein [Oscillospiraceae bacterium]